MGESLHDWLSSTNQHHPISDYRYSIQYEWIKREVFGNELSRLGLRYREMPLSAEPMFDFAGSRSSGYRPVASDLSIWRICISLSLHFPHMS